LTLDNPKYKEIIANYSHLEGVIMPDKDEKERLPMHLILGTGDYSKIKTPSKPRVGSPGEPISKPEPAILCGGLLRLWETPAKIGL
jgi:hypothetical protein